MQLTKNLLAWAVFVGVSMVGTNGMSEEKRVQEHFKRYGDALPPIIPSTEGWTKLMEKRMAQVQSIEARGEKYDGWIQTVAQAFVQPNFTDYGWGIVRGPEELSRVLLDEVIGAYKAGKARNEHKILAIEGPEPCLFVDRPDLTKRVVNELQPYTEAWAGIPLTPAIAYGFRLYQNNSVLNMHVDKSQSHIISMIYHIDHSEDSEPWPLLIEDFEGNTHEVVLEAGDVLFYESSKCLHGRPKPFIGTYYSSVFVHYYPKYDWLDMDHDKETHYAIPPGWADVIPLEDGIPPLRIRGTSFKEPTCPHSWCSTQDTKKWFGPGEDNFWIDAKGAKHPFEPRLIDVEEEL